MPTKIAKIAKRDIWISTIFRSKLGTYYSRNQSVNNSLKDTLISWLMSTKIRTNYNMRFLRPLISDFKSGNLFHRRRSEPEYLQISWGRCAGIRSNTEGDNRIPIRADRRLYLGGSDTRGKRFREARRPPSS